ncbi:MAG: N-formylglutamate amidohydrolase [Proteobacteria bacterium]|nr:N-formylglutamate amidohydrolase [Pseudomonadota bacterium]
MKLVKKRKDSSASGPQNDGRGSYHPRLLLTCEHASNAVPASLKEKLNIPASILKSHRGWDPGTLELAQAIAKATHTKIFQPGKMSRLVVDLNRTETNPDVFSKWSRDHLSATERQKLAAQHRKFRRAALSAASRMLLTRKNHVIHLSIHSFTPVMKGQRRRTDIGILFDPKRPAEKKFANQLIRILKTTAIAEKITGLRIDANKPYLGTADGHTTELRRKLSATRYSGIEIEVNQKFVRTTGIARWPVILRVISMAVAELLDPNRLEHLGGTIKKPVKTAHRTRHVGGRIARGVSGRSSKGRR